MNIRNTTFLVVLAAVSALLPFVMSVYWQDVLFLFMINVLVIISYRLIVTMGGWSFAHVAIMGLGGYTLAMLTTKHAHISFWLVLPLGGLAPALFAFLTSFAVLRTKQFYFFLSTFAAGEALRQAFIQFRGVFGGLWGIPFIKRPESILGIDFTNNLAFYYLILIVTFASGLILYRLDKSRIGRTIRAIAADDSLCESFGVNTWGYKIAVQAIGSFFVGLAGVLFAAYNGFVAPTDFTTFFMFKFVAAAIIGGTTSFAGPILGLLFVTTLQELLRDLQEWLPLVYGVSIIAILMFMPNGIESRLPALAGRPAVGRSPLSRFGLKTGGRPDGRGAAPEEPGPGANSASRKG